MNKYLIILLILLFTSCDPNGFYTIKYEIEVISLVDGDVIDTYQSLDNVEYEIVNGYHVYHFLDLYRTKTRVVLKDSSLINIRYVGDRR